MLNKFSSFFLIIVLTISSLTLIRSCSNRDETVDCFPHTEIAVSIDLSSPYYFSELQKNWTYIAPGEAGQLSGTRGLILYKKANGDYLVYDRNAPHICPDNGTTLKVITDTDGFLKIHCPKDGMKWVLELEAQPDASITNIRPLRYYYQLNGNIMSIYNN